MKTHHFLPPSGLKKKLKPAKKAWRSFTSKLQSKLQDQNIPKAIKATAHRLLEFFTRRLFLPFKQRFLNQPPYLRRRHPRYYHYQQPYQYQYQYHYQQENQPQKNFRAIYIDQLYAEPAAMQGKKHSSAQAGTSRGEEEVGKDVLPRTDSERKSESPLESIEDAWKVVVARSPHLRPVDDRAEEFIYQFREQRRIEKARSSLEFQEMLARGT